MTNGMTRRVRQAALALAISCCAYVSVNGALADVVLSPFGRGAEDQIIGFLIGCCIGVIVLLAIVEK